MNKINVVIVLLNKQSLQATLSSLNFNKANLVAIVIENGIGQFLQIGNQKIPLVSFVSIQQVFNFDKNLVWLISGIYNDTANLRKVKKFLMANGVPENNIVNFYVSSYITPAWIANLRYVEKYGVDFFATGISYMKDGLNLNFIPHSELKGINLSSSNQDLSQAT